MRRYSLTCAVTVVIFAVSTQIALAGTKQAFCADYADESVAQQRRNIEYNCGYTGLRWHDWWDGHFGWCKDWVSADKVDEEQELRRIQMAKCTGNGGRRGERHSGYEPGRSYGDRDGDGRR